MSGNGIQTTIDRACPRRKDWNMPFSFGPRRGTYVNIAETLHQGNQPLVRKELECFERFDLFYRSLCAMLYNYVPTSGHPGGSISSGRFVTGILFDAMDYDVSNPDRPDADIISYAAGHKALGLYSLWALRNEVVRIGRPDLLPSEDRFQLRLEDLLGFRKNVTTNTPLFEKFHAKALDGHPTPATPFIRLATGASGVGVGASIGLAIGALDYFGRHAPCVHIVEGECGMTPGRVYEAMATAGSASLGNVILHVDWNQASIDSNRVCREGTIPGDYVQWDPMELAYLHDWNVIHVPDGRDFQQILAAQRYAKAIGNSQPTAIVYRTVKGWQYGIEGKASHGAGHKLCADGFYAALNPFLEGTDQRLPRCDAAAPNCRGGKDAFVLETCFWETLTVIREELEKNRPTVDMLCGKLADARERLVQKNRKPRPEPPDINAVFDAASREADRVPEELKLVPGSAMTLREQLGRILNYYNKASRGALLLASADLLESTSIKTAGKGFPEGFYNGTSNPASRFLATGGICEDAMTAILSGISSFGRAIGTGSSYGSFLAPLGHIAARLHAIGNQARQAIQTEPYRTVIYVCGHAGLKTGEDGPTHADPQCLQMLQGNFPAGTLITLTPWEPQEMWALVTAGLARRPAVLTPFVTRPSETVIDREKLSLAPTGSAATGIYLLLGDKRRQSDGTIVLQGSEAAYAFVQEAMPLLVKAGIDLNVYYVASSELFDFLSPAEQEEVFPLSEGEKAMGITGFTLPTMYRWIRSEAGRKATLHPFMKGRYLGSGQADKVIEEAGLDGYSQFMAIKKYLKAT